METATATKWRGLLRRKKNLLEKYAELARRQQTLTGEMWHVDALEKVLDEKQALIAQIDRLNAALVRVAEQQPFRAEQDACFRVEIRKLEQEIVSLAEATHALEKECLQKARQYLSAQSRVQELFRRKLKAGNSYHDSPRQYDGVFIDQKK